jgi:Helix-turn-helix domain
VFYTDLNTFVSTIKSNKMEQNVILSSISFEEMMNGIREVVKMEIQDNKKAELQEKLLSPADTCKLFQPTISKVTLWNWTKEGKLQEHRIGGKVFYKYSEVMAALQTLKRYKTGGKL